MIVQHDRSFMAQFNDLTNVLDCMNDNHHIRYVGFPTVNSLTHDSVIRNYGLQGLVSPEKHIAITSDYVLKPLIFWYDSNHVCKISRYLEIYRPFTFVPPEMKDIVGVKGLKSMFMKNGHFIEDRFGQA